MNVDKIKIMESYTNKNIRKITKTGRGSYYVIIPKAMIKNLGWKEKQKVIIKTKRKEIIIKGNKI
jgi:bifunctional DNA-binding transcriptional regulator/antitoxin component of YhaV-PrlF toxin-antitoxin module